MNVQDPSFSLNTLLLISTLVGGLTSGAVSIAVWSFRAAETRHQLQQADKDINTALALIRRDFQQLSDETRSLKSESLNRRNLLFRLINHLNERGMKFKFEESRHDEII
ncbi:MAG: hypothetical protein ACRC2V_22600 [Xenococcaceae cyanobacterium]